MTHKKAIILSARGGVYSTPEEAPMEMSANYIKNVVGGVFGMEIIDEVIIEGHAAMPAQAETIIAEGLEKVKAAAKKLSAVAV
jgi:FMN-dependent NADH-azoreductase